MLNIGSKLLLATSNSGKLVEFRKMLSGLDVSIQCLFDFEPVVEVEESGSTFVENAAIKAAHYAIRFGLPTIADDSGLEVIALNGRPGVLSARYGGETTFSEKMALLLAELRNSESLDRRARFVSAIAFADQSGKIIQIVEGECTGTIAEMPRGRQGFGYDPIFIPDGFEQTFGEISAVVKSHISHRALSFSKIMPYLRDFYAV